MNAGGRPRYRQVGEGRPGLRAAGVAVDQHHGAAAGERLGVDAVATADAVLVPGLAVSSRGERLGRGGGSYDRALGRVPVGTFTCVLLHDEEVGIEPRQDWLARWPLKR